MDVDSWLGVLLLLGCALGLFLTAVSSAAGIFNRRPYRPPVGRGAARPENLHQFLHDRESFISSLVFARTVSIVTGGITAGVIVMRRTGVSARPAIVTLVLVMLAAELIEGIPRVVVSHNPERWHDRVVLITVAIHGAFFVPAMLIDLPGKALLRFARFRPNADDDDQDEEIVRLVELEESQGRIEDDERQMIRAVIELEDTTAREIMVPRIDITAVGTGESMQDVAAIIAVHGYSRIPLYEGNIDNIVGVVYAKDVLARFAQGAGDVDIRTIARPPLFVPETKRVDELLSELRDRRIHMAVVVDEYGGTSGLLTIEDLVEEIVGEIEDEYDHAEPNVVLTGEHDAVVDARQRVDILKELFDVEPDQGDFDTVGGFIIHQLGKIPSPGDTVAINGLSLKVLSVTGRRIRKVRITRMQSDTAGQN
ncbi:MAG TPA: hemolysin family protein [Dehalococcoidia bacterium]